MTTAEIRVSRPAAATRCGRRDTRRTCVERMARALFAQHHCFRGRTEVFEFACHAQVLTVRGCVPSFYLKQVLQTLLKGLAGVERIDNQVDVVCSGGLSSVRV